MRFILVHPGKDGKMDVRLGDVVVRTFESHEAGAAISLARQMQDELVRQVTEALKMDRSSFVTEIEGSFHDRMMEGHFKNSVPCLHVIEQEHFICSIKMSYWEVWRSGGDKRISYHERYDLALSEATKIAKCDGATHVFVHRIGEEQKRIKV